MAFTPDELNLLSSIDPDARALFESMMERLDIIPDLTLLDDRLVVVEAFTAGMTDAEAALRVYTRMQAALVASPDRNAMLGQIDDFLATIE